MSRLPIILRDFFITYNRAMMRDFFNPSISLDGQHLKLLNDNFLRASQAMLSSPQDYDYRRPWRYMDQADGGISIIQNYPSNFRINLNVQQFKPEEISVKVTGDDVVFEAKHEEDSDKHGYISCQFFHRLKLPENVDLQKIKSTLSSDGVLTFTAPKKNSAEDGKEIVQEIPIIMTDHPIDRNDGPSDRPDPRKATSEENEK